MRVAAAAKLNKRYAGQPIGYTVLSVDRVQLGGFNSDVVEPTPAYYVATDGANVPDAGGFICWGFKSGETIIEESVPPAAPDYTDPLRVDLSERFASLEESFAMWFDQMRGHISDEARKTLEAVKRMQALSDDLKNTKSELIEALSASLSEIDGKLSPQSSNMQYISELIERLEESQSGELDIGNQLATIARSINGVQAALGTADQRIGGIEQQISGLRESAEPKTDNRQIDTLRALEEAIELLS